MFAERLKKLRTDKGLSQEDLAKVVGVKQQTIGGWETGRTEPDHQITCKLADFFGVTTDDLLGRKLLKGQIISTDHPDIEVTQLLKDNGVAKLKLAKDVTLEELALGIKLAKALREEKQGK